MELAKKAACGQTSGNPPIFNGAHPWNSRGCEIIHRPVRSPQQNLRPLYPSRMLELLLRGRICFNINWNRFSHSQVHSLQGFRAVPRSVSGSIGTAGSYSPQRATLGKPEYLPVFHANCSFQMPTSGLADVQGLRGGEIAASGIPRLRSSEIWLSAVRVRGADGNAPHRRKPPVV